MENGLYPFFWQHGENHTVLREYMDKISESGMKGVCVEARPHPDFLGEQWWSDLDLILEKAKENQMKVWILDDSHFPTGYANGKIKENYPEYLKQYQVYEQNDERRRSTFMYRRCKKSERGKPIRPKITGEI